MFDLLKTITRVGTLIDILHSFIFPVHERTTTAKNMGILKYHETSLIGYERGWPLASYQTKPGHQGAR
jgi:hypothetical protein